VFESIRGLPAVAGRRQDDIVTDRQQLAVALVVDAARDAVSRIAPEELEVFDGVAAGWQERTAKGTRQWAAPGSSVGFGIDTALFSELFLQAVGAAVTEVLVLGATGLGAGIRPLATPSRDGPVANRVAGVARCRGVDRGVRRRGD
jgi:hypothetical protein